MEDMTWRDRFAAPSRRLEDGLIKSGWHRTPGDVLSHPTRPELNVSMDPDFCSPSLSAKLVELLIEHKQPWVTVLLEFLATPQDGTDSDLR